MEQVKVEEIKRIEVSVTHAGRTFQLIMPADSTIGAAYDGAYAILLRILEIAKENTEKARPQEME